MVAMNKTRNDVIETVFNFPPFCPFWCMLPNKLALLDMREKFGCLNKCGIEDLTIEIRKIRPAFFIQTQSSVYVKIEIGFYFFQYLFMFPQIYFLLFFLH